MLNRNLRFSSLILLMIVSGCKKADELLGNADIEPPSITVSYPVDNAIISNNVTIRAVATDNKKIVKVVFFVDGNHISTDTLEPYTCYWNVSSWADDGKHTIIITAEDAAKNKSQSTPITVTVSQLAKYIPSLRSPDDGAEIDSTSDLTLRWNKVISVNQYEVQLSENPDFLNIVKSDVVGDTLLVFSNVSEGEYFWRVRALFGSTQNSIWSSGSRVSVRAKVAPELTGPYNGQVIDTTQADFTWKPVQGVERYHYQVSRTDDFVQLIVDDSTSKNAVSVQLGSYGDFYWRIQSQNSRGRYGAWSPASRFSASSKVVAPELVFPLSNQRFDTTQIRFVWRKIKKAVSYIFQVSEKSDFSTLTESINLSDTTQTIQLELLKTYYWRVRSNNSLGEPSGWSSTKTFSTILNTGGFIKIFGGMNDDVGMYGIEMTNGQYVVGGITYSQGMGGGDAWLVCTSPSGEKLWDKMFGGASEDRFNFIAESAGGGLILAGYTRSKGAGNEDGYIVKTDVMGNMLWEKTVGGGGDDAILSLTEDVDGSIICAGYTNSYEGFYQGWIIKLSTTGEKIWHRTYGGTGGDFGQHIERTEDGFVMSGVYGSKTGNSYDYWLLKVDKQGYLVWEKTYGDASDDRAIRFCKTSDGGFALTGYSTVSGSLDVWLVKVDHAGEYLWSKYFGANKSDFGITIQATANNELIQTGYMTDSNGNQNLFLIKTSSVGDLIFNEVFGDYGMESGTSVRQTKDGGFFITGWTTTATAGGKDLLIIKTDVNGISE